MRDWAVAVAVAGALTCDVATWSRVFESYWLAYPKAEAADVYKLAHQGIMGSEHAVGSAADAHAWMQREIAELPSRPETSLHQATLIEALPPDGRFVRVHLRPYLARNGQPGALSEGFVATANSARGDTAVFACAIRGLAASKTSNNVQPVMAFFREQQKRGYNAVHHSVAFEAAYAPAYRVLESSWVQRLVSESRLR